MRLGLRHTHAAGEIVGLNETGDGLWEFASAQCCSEKWTSESLRIEDHKERWIRRKVLPMSPD